MTDRGALAPAPDPLPGPAFDAHTHLDACTTGDGPAAALDRAHAARVETVVTVADDLAAARWAAETAAADQRVFAAVGLHPTRTGAFDEQARREIERLVTGPRVVSVGETGLDYYWPEHDPNAAPPSTQQQAFRWHIELAKRVGLALMIHDRDAHEDVLAVLDEQGAPDTVIMHCFSGDAAIARRCIEAGYLISLSGIVTFRNARAVREAAMLVPDDQLLVETDAPFLTPHPHRGRPNEPVNLGYTLRGLAELRGADLGELTAATTANARRTYGLDR